MNWVCISDYFFLKQVPLSKIAPMRFDACVPIGLG